MKVPMRVLKTVAEVNKFLGVIYPKNRPGEGWKVAGIDTEYDPMLPTTDPHRLAYFQVSNGEERVVIEGPLASRAQGRNLHLPKLFKEWLEDPKAKKAISTTGADLRTLKWAGCGTLQGVVGDTEVMDWLLDENRRVHNLKENASDHLNFHMKKYKDVFGFIPEGKKKAIVPSMTQVLEGKEGGHPVPWTAEEGRKKAEHYASLDPYASVKLYKFYRPKLEAQGLWEWYRQVERPFTQVLLNMEDRGIGLDRLGVVQVARKVGAEMLRLEATFKALAEEPEEFNLRSGPQLQKLFFEKLGWPVKERNDLTPAQAKKGQKLGNPCLDAAVLKDYAKDGYKLADLLVRHRSNGTMSSTFLVPMIDETRHSEILYTKFWQARVVTGRLSSGNRKEGLMNLQNIPARKDKDPHGIRRYFRPRTKGNLLIVADYSQIELYIIAELSGDKRMIEAFSRGEDLHMLTAAKIFNLKLPREPKSWDPSHPDYKRWLEACEEWKERYSDPRKSAKIVNFGLNYGMSSYKLSNDFSMSEEEAQVWIDAYFDLYPGVKRYMETTIAFCRKNGYVLTIAGRRRRLPEINARPRNSSYESKREAARIRAGAERQAINSPIQGSAGDIIKVAMCALELGSKYKSDWIDPQPEADKARELGAEMLLQVHDELVFEAPAENAQKVVPLVKKVMEAPFPKRFSKVKYKASVGVGPNWLQAKN